MIQLDGIPGWFDFDDVYTEAVNKAPSDKISTFVEIGTAFGKSACFMGDLIRTSKKPIDFYTVDPFIEEIIDTAILDWVNHCRATTGAATMKEMAESNIKQFGLEAIVKVFHGTSEQASHQFDFNTVDFIFIDGDHKYQSVHDDIMNWWHRLKPGATMAGHDLGGEVEKAVRELHTARGFKPISQRSWITQKEYVS